MIWSISLKRTGEAAFVVHDTAAGVSALVDTVTVLAAVDKSGLSYDVNVERSGLWDVLRRDQITVGNDEAASDVADRAVDGDRELAVVVNDANEPVGIFVIASVVERVVERHVLPDVVRRGAVQLVKSDAGPSEILRYVEGAVTAFHSENLNSRSPALWMCSGPPEHRTPRRPCKSHARAVVSSLSIY